MLKYLSACFGDQNSPPLGSLDQTKLIVTTRPPIAQIGDDAVSILDRHQFGGEVEWRRIDARETAVEAARGAEIADDHHLADKVRVGAHGRDQEQKWLHGQGLPRIPKFIRSQMMLRNVTAAKKAMKLFGTIVSAKLER